MEKGNDLTNMMRGMECNYSMGLWSEELTKPKYIFLGIWDQDHKFLISMYNFMVLCVEVLCIDLLVKCFGGVFSFSLLKDHLPTRYHEVWFHIGY